MRHTCSSKTLPTNYISSTEAAATQSTPQNFTHSLTLTAEEALKQIDDKGYAEPYAADKRKLFKVGVVFSSEKKNITEWKVV